MMRFKVISERTKQEFEEALNDFLRAEGGQLVFFSVMPHDCYTTYSAIFQYVPR